MTEKSDDRGDNTPRSGSVVGRLTDVLRRDISLGRIKPGHRLKIEEMRARYHVSHPSAREALSILAGEGFVDAIDQRGFWVAASSLADLTDLSRVRTELECIAFDWSVARRTTDWRAQVVAAHFALNEVEEELPGDPHNLALQWDERNRDFHLAVAGQCGSERLLGLIRSHYDLTRRYRLMVLSGEQWGERHESWRLASAAEHLALKEAVIKGDGARGRKILRHHILKKAETEGAGEILHLVAS